MMETLMILTAVVAFAPLRLGILAIEHLPLSVISEEMVLKKT
jgi:hypothetical protein